MSKKKTLFIGLQVLAITVFVGMALACKTTALPGGPTIERQYRSACGSPDYVFMGQYADLPSCSSVCRAAGLGSPCVANGNCFCK